MHLRNVLTFFEIPTYIPCPPFTVWLLVQKPSGIIIYYLYGCVSCDHMDVLKAVLHAKYMCVIIFSVHFLHAFLMCRPCVTYLSVFLMIRLNANELQCRIVFTIYCIILLNTNKSFRGLVSYI